MSCKTAISIDIGATNTRVALIDNLGQLLYIKKIKTAHINSNDEFANFIIDFVVGALSEKEITNSCGLGLSITGFINTDRGLLVKSPNLPNKDWKIVANFEDYFQKKVILNNDTNAAIIAEKTWGYGKNVNNFALLTFSSGIGGSIFLNNKLITNQFGSSLEIGHITIDSKYDLLCGCGGKNHWESYASGINMPEFLHKWSEKNNIKITFNYSNNRSIFRAINDGNSSAISFFEEVQ